MLNVRTVYRMECDKCGRIASDYSDWFQDKDGHTYCGPCAGKVEGLEPLGNPAYAASCANTRSTAGTDSTSTIRKRTAATTATN